MSTHIKDEISLKELIASGRDVFVLFYAGWCGFCTAFLPVFEKNACGPDCFKVIVDDNGSIEDAYAIEYVPTVIFFRKGAIQARLDAIPGRGLSEAMLLDMMKSCGLAAAKEGGGKDSA